MKFSALLLLVMVLSFVPVAQAESVGRVASEQGGVSVEAPTSWTSRAVEDPMLLVLTDPKNQYAIVVFREPKADMGVADLKEYFEFKLEKISGAWQDAKLDQAQAGDVNGKPARWVGGTATMVDPKGIKIPSRVVLAAVEGPEYYYLLLMTVRASAGANAEAVFPQILKSFQAP
jgi:hypothetical protein